MNDQSSTLDERFTIHRLINPQYEESSDAERRSEHKRWQKQPTIVAKRNARERTRVHTVNQAFVTLKYHLPSLRAHTKRVSKLKILNAAICYIDSLVAILKSITDHGTHVAYSAVIEYEGSFTVILMPFLYLYRLMGAAKPFFLKNYDASVARTALPPERRQRTAHADRSLIQSQAFPYMQSLLDCPPYLSNQPPHTQNFMMNSPFILPSAYHQ